MDFLYSINFLKIEIIFLILNVAYLFFHVTYDITGFFLKIKRIVKPNRNILDDDQIKSAIQEKIESMDVVSIDLEEELDEEVSESTLIPEENEKVKDYSEIELSKDQKEIISEIVKLVKNKIWRWEYSDAKAKIIEWLSVSKFDKDLNILLASLYEKDKDYKKAELIYKDLIVLNSHDTEIYLKLWFILSIQSKYEIAYEIYKKLNSIDKSNIEALEMLCNLAHHLWNYEESKDYSKFYLKKYPKNIDILYLQALNLINLWDRSSALEFLQKVRQLEPYNVKVNDMIEKIKLELELENNFTTQYKN